MFRDGPMQRTNNRLNLADLHSGGSVVGFTSERVWVRKANRQRSQERPNNIQEGPFECGVGGWIVRERPSIAHHTT
jgi:hypothetical protein